MAEASILTAITNLEGSTIGKRSEGLDDLKRLLGERRNAPDFGALEDDVFHKIFELLYRIIAKEKPSFIRATAKTTKSTAASRLQVAAAALRLTVEAASSTINSKTAFSVFDHVIDTLPLTDGSLCEPLKNDYLKSFRILLEYAPHGEHMRPKQWQKYVDFALDCLSTILQDPMNEDNATNGREPSGTPRNDRSLSVRLSQRSSRSLDKEKFTLAEEIVSALRNLTSVTNAHIMSRATVISEGMHNFLSVAGTGQAEAFEAVNNIMSISISEDVTFTQNLLSRLVPIMRRLWPVRSPSLREQMVLTLFTCRHLFVTSSSSWPPIDAVILEPLFVTLLSDYRTRGEKDILHFDDMQPVLASETVPLQLRQFKPLRISARAVTCWLTLEVIACLVLGLSRRTRPSSSNSDNDGSSRKRPKVQTHFDEILELATTGSGQEKLIALQIILFLFDQPCTDECEWKEKLQSLLPDIMNEDSTVQTWVFLVYSRLALDAPPENSPSSDFWLHAWGTARRSMATASTVRAACHLLNTILGTGVLDSSMTGNLLESCLFGGGNNGPGSLTDTSLILMTTALRSKFFDNDRRFEAVCMKIIGWLAVRWTLPANLDRLHNAHIVSHVRPELLYALLISICGLWDATMPSEDWTPAHSLFKASMLASTNQQFVFYMLSIPPVASGTEMAARALPRQLDNSVAVRLTRAVIDFLDSQIREFHQAWKTISTERTSNISSDIVDILAVISTVTSSILTRCREHVAEFEQPLVLSEIWHTLTDFIARQNVKTCRDMAARVCSCVVTMHVQLSGNRVKNYQAEYQTLVESTLILARRSVAANSLNDLDPDILDDDIWDSQATQNSQTNAVITTTRLELPICQDTLTLLSRYTIQLATALQMIKSQGALDPAATTAVLDEIIALDPASLLSARGAVKDFLALETLTSREDTYRLFKKLGDVFLQQTAFERCEAALCFCLQALQSTVGLWTADEDDDLAEASFDIYDWFLNTALQKGLVSPQVLSVLADLLDVMLLRGSSYGGDDLPSPRTSLLKILEVASPTHQYRLADKLSHIFEKYILTQHDAIFDDIVGKLSLDPSNKEGIAVRLHIVSHLGARWHTVLRQTTYHVFETVAHVPSASKLAHDCITRICRALNLKHPRQLFKLFSSQIFYTWLSEERLSAMPFQPFEYASLQEMAIDNIAELTGQIALRGMGHGQDLAQLTGVEWNALLVDRFAHAEAYCLASETSLPKQERLCDGSEKLVRKQLGNQLYLQRLRECLPDVVVLLAITMQDDKGIEKALSSDSLAAWQEMVDHSGQQSQLPLAQQPCFRARCFPEELNYLYSRLDMKPEHVWTPPLLVYLCRQLLDKARPALGPLHTCSIIRKIRIAISLAGSVALSGYPLEMLLHSLRPYLTLFECAGDAMGIYRFLLSHGAPYLSTRPSFIAGLCVAIFASLTGFIGSSQDSTTQESHFLTTMNEAQEFRAFLGQYLESIELKNATTGACRTYKLIVQHAKAISQPGRSANSTNEGQLLYALLMDQSNDDPLLSKVHFELSMEILSRAFVISADYQDDILYKDDDASRVLPILQGLLRNLELDSTFRIWAAQAMGRGFVMRGLASGARNVAYEQESTGQIPKDGLKAIASYTSIVRHLVDLLWTSEYPASTLAENTLQLIFTELTGLDARDFLAADFPTKLVQDLSFSLYPCPTAPVSFSSSPPDEENRGSDAFQRRTNGWASQVLVQISEAAPNDPVLRCLAPLIKAIPDSAGVMLPYAVHLILLGEINSHQIFRENLSQKFSEVLSPSSNSQKHAQRLILKTLLYLRKCGLPNEANMAQRNTWLEVDLGNAAMAASELQMWHEALLFLELHYSQAQLQTGRSSRRSAIMTDGVPVDVISKIYERVDDPDFFYGKHQTYDLQSVINKMSHEGASQKSLSFQSAMLDSQLRITEQETILGEVASTTALTLSAANMQGISEAVRQHYEVFQKSTSAKNDLSSAQWDLLSSSDSSPSSPSLVTLFRIMHNTSNKEILLEELDSLLLDTVRTFRLQDPTQDNASRIRSKFAILAEARQIVGARTVEDLESISTAIAERNKSTKLAEFQILSPVLAGRETAFSAIRRNNRLRSTFSLNLQQALLFEIRITRQSLDAASSYDIPQFSLNRAMYLSELNRIADSVGLKVDVATQYDLARTLWTQDESSTSIGILEDLRTRKDSPKQAITVTRADILTDLGYKIAEARLEKPDEIIERYLAPAIHELNGSRKGSAAGRVFHNFASFCDMQLQDSDNLDDFTRISKIRERKTQEVRELERMVRSSRNEQQKSKLKSHWARARNWLKLDEEEWKRVSENREALILQCLENYLLSMQASDDYQNDILRFIALWLNQAESPMANSVVHKHLSSVPTLKFAPLVNQLSSRLMDMTDDFQRLLQDLMFRICSDHPYHSLYQVFATSKSKAPPGDDIAASRWTAANKLTDRIKEQSTSSAVWTALHNICIALNRVAVEPLSDKDGKSGSKVQLRKLQAGPGLETQITKPTSRIPPPTMNIALRADRDYSSLPTSTSIDPLLSVAGGVSAPKIATITASDGSRHKLLLKGGNDDLRQDAIMEQVFEQVSNLLKDHRATRQRNLGIRTYKVIPLTKNSGIIEFVQNTIPLNDYLLPAHGRYYPRDYKSSKARNDIANAQSKSLDQRLRAYQLVTSNFHPVMRFFFMEKFLDPDEWFYKRLNYSRSTAAVSILGHVLGLGDRHGHNILLDEKTGEVVHIDLGVAFEAGRILPVPEVVPFRLTRDLVDGMGLTGVEGVFRRCCNFTLEALRRDQEAIMTILDVLRYDPLYSWSVSPLRLRKMQENNEAAAGTSMSVATSISSAALGNDAAGVIAARREEAEPSEADRALTVVAKKLGKALSVEATVNGLIRQATDERNLAVLYCGWAAYA